VTNICKHAQRGVGARLEKIPRGDGFLSGADFSSRTWVDDAQGYPMTLLADRIRPFGLIDAEAARRVAAATDARAAAASAASAAAAAGHLPALDGVRGLAILLVMLTHFTLVQGGPVVDRVVGMLGRFGWSGVDLFFVLSGFLITGILLDAKGEPNYFRTFYARRTLRIFPLYYAFIFLATIVVPLLRFSWTDHFRTEGWTTPLYWLYLSNFAITFSADAGNDLLGLTWSLAIEEQFYLVWPVLVLVLSRRSLAWTCAGAVAVSVLTRSAFVLAGADRLHAYVLTPCRMDGLAIGCFVALVLRSDRTRSVARRARELLPRVKWLGLACAAGIVALVGYHRTTSFVGGPGQALGYTVVALFYACVLVWVLASTETGIASRLFTQGWLTTLGKYSYALYLFHMAIHRLVREYVYGPDDFHTLGGSRLPGQIVFYFICASLSFVAALLSWHGIERHFLRLKVRFPTRRDDVEARPAQRLVPAAV
jgi:peptidoglycan/LPS O-acetylase OafA/YrhL